MTRYMMPARSQGKLYAQRAAASTAAGAKRDEIVPVGLQGSIFPDAVKAVIKAAGSNPHLSVRGRSFCLDDMERGTI